MKRRTLIAGAAGASLLPFAPRPGLAQNGALPNAKRGGEMVIAIVQPPPSLDARRAEEFDESASRLLDGREDDGEGEQFDAAANFIRVTDDQ